jgi:hypothetical protein
MRSAMVRPFQSLGRNHGAILAHAISDHKWRSSSRSDDKCHPMPHMMITTPNAMKKLRRNSLEPHFIRGRAI